MGTPTITFQVDLLTVMVQESIQANPGQVNVALDTHGVDSAKIAFQRSIFLPGLGQAGGKYLSHGQQFTMDGYQAIYFRKQYAQGYATDPSLALLKIVSTVN